MQKTYQQINKKKGLYKKTKIIFLRSKMNTIQQKQTQKCQKHLESKIEFIQVNDLNNQQQQNKNLFYCSTCINEDLQFKGINYLLIQQIIDQGSTHIIQKWPPVNDYSIIQSLIYFTNKQNHSSSVIKQITNYFTLFKEEFSNKIDLSMKKMINQALDLPLQNDSILKAYQEISSITQLKKLLENDESDNQIKQQSEQLRVFLALTEQKKEQNTQLLQNLLSSCQQKENLINFEFPNQLKKSILDFIDQITFFNSDIQSNAHDLSQHEYNESGIEKIMNLISNKSNYCSNSFLSQVKEQLLKVNPLIQQCNFDHMFIENKKPINFQEISEQQLELVSEYVNHTLQMNKSIEYQNEVKNSIQIKQISKIFSNKMNFINNNFQEQFDKYLNDTYPFLKQINFTNMISEEGKFQCLYNLSDEMRDDLIQLFEKRREIEQNNDYHNSQTNYIEQQIKDHCRTCYQQEEIQKILTKYPIFDLLEQYDKYQFGFTIPNFDLVKTNWINGYQQLQINKNHNKEFEVFLNREYTDQVSCVSNITLEKEKKYIFRIKIEIPDNLQKYFLIGLMQNQNTETKGGYNDRLSCYLTSNNNLITQFSAFGIDKEERPFEMGIEKQIEMRVCLKDQVLEIKDYPGYKCKIEVNNQSKQNLINFDQVKLYLGLYQPNLKIILKDAFTINDFPK